MSEYDEIPEWILEDLKKSGLNLKNFPIEPLTSEQELRERLGFTSIAGTPITTVGGYWIPYPNTLDFYRLKLREKIRDAKYISPKGRGTHPYILPEVAKILEKYSPDKTIYITEGEKKAAKATLEGFPSIGLAGVFNFKDKENDFLNELEHYVWKNKLVYIVFDSDITHKYEVRRAELRLSIVLSNRGANVHSIRLPNEADDRKNGLDDFIVRHGAESFQELIEIAQPTLELHINEGTDKELIFDELYRLKDKIVEEQVLKALAKREGVKMDLVKAEYQKRIPKEEKNDKSTQETFTEEQVEKAKSLLKSPDILSRVLAITKHLGFTGEEINQKLLYLAFTSRLMENSISLILKGPSAGGKSFITYTVIRLIPESEVLSFSYITPKSLVHRHDDLSHKILYIAELSGSEGADYSIRTMLSEGELSIMIPVKNEATGNFETVEKRIPAKGLVFVETTTRDRVHAENQTRVFDLYIDDSKTQTENILFIQAEQLGAESSEVQEEVKIFQAAQTLLNGYKVYIPYAREIAKVFPKDKIRARRDYPRLLSLIQIHTLLYQFQRQTGSDGRLIAKIEDFEAILPLAETVLAQSMKELSPKHEKTLEIIQSNFNYREFSLKELSENANGVATYRTLQRYCEYFTKEGLLEWNGIKGAGSRYTLSSPVSLCRNRRFFPPNLLESLKNNYATHNCRNDDVIGTIDDNYDNNAKLRQNGDVAIKSNDYRQLTPDNPEYDNNTRGVEGDSSLNNIESTDNSDLEEEVEEFLKLEDSKI